jgi:[protein-PII] uridylyltransferase
VHAAERIAETRVEALALLHYEGLDGAAIEAVWNALPDEVFLRYRASQVAWQTAAIVAQKDAADDLVAVRSLGDSGLLELFVHARDRDGLFAAAVATLDRLGLGVLEARALATRNGRVFDSFQVLPAHPDRSLAHADVIKALRTAIQRPDKVRPTRRALPRTLRHFSMVPRVEFSNAGELTRMTLVTSDRPGLLAGVAQVLRDQRLRVHDARIATFGERAEDFFVVSDAVDRALDAGGQQALRDALVARIDGETV